METDRAGWLKHIPHIISPNFDDRPAGIELELIVIHGISIPAGHFGSGAIHKLFSNTLKPTEYISADLCALRVSAHALIQRDGTVVQYVAFEKRAWHAGVSQFKHRQRCNDFAIGIELEGTDEIPYEPAQYTTLALLVTTLRQRWPTLKNLVGHSDIASGRKTDPGPAFRWEQLFACLNVH